VPPYVATATMCLVFGGGSIQFARVFGIRIGADPSWFFVLFLIIWSLSGYYGDLFPGDEGKSFALAVISALLFFGSVLLHELGHALEAKRSGIGIAGIDLWMFGGVARMERDTRSAGEEFRVAAAGPVVTLVIAVACYAAGALIGGTDSAYDSVRFESGSADEAVAVLGYLAFINGILLVFNLIPAFPLDGGRIARAIAWWRTGDRTRATRFAGQLGRGFSFLMIALGVYLLFQGAVVSGVWLAIIGVFLGQAARSAVAQTELTRHLEGLRVADVMDTEPVAVPSELSIERAYEEYFLRYRWPWFPVVDGEGRFVGLITLASVEGMPEELRPGRIVGSVMAADGEADSSLRVDAEEPLEELLGRESLIRLGAIMAVDGEGRLRGVVTAGDVRRALQGSTVAV
jgi:Zn-dependent protease